MMQAPPPPPPYPGSPYQVATAAMYESPRTGLATGALVLGLISLPTNCVCIGPLLGLIAVILGVVALMRASSAPYMYGGSGRAIAGVATGGISVVIVVVLSIAAATAGMSLGQFISQGLGVGGVAVDLANVGKAVRLYHATHGEYPPDLDALAAADMISENPVPFAGDDPTAGMSYVTGLSPEDPSNWILAYKKAEIFGIKLVGVLYNAASGGAGRGDVGDVDSEDLGEVDGDITIDDGEVTVRDGNDATVYDGDYDSGAVEMLEAAEFAEEWVRFKREYEEARGEPPTVIERRDQSSTADARP